MISWVTYRIVKDGGHAIGEYESSSSYTSYSSLGQYYDGGQFTIDQGESESASNGSWTYYSYLEKSKTSKTSYAFVTKDSKISASGHTEGTYKFNTPVATILSPRLKVAKFTSTIIDDQVFIRSTSTRKESYSFYSTTKTDTASPATTTIIHSETESKIQIYKLVNTNIEAVSVVDELTFTTWDNHNDAQYIKEDTIYQDPRGFAVYYLENPELLTNTEKHYPQKHGDYKAISKLRYTTATRTTISGDLWRREYFRVLDPEEAAVTTRVIDLRVSWNEYNSDESIYHNPALSFITAGRFGQILDYVPNSLDSTRANNATAFYRANRISSLQATSEVNIQYASVVPVYETIKTGGRGQTRELIGDGNPTVSDEKTIATFVYFSSFTQEAHTTNALTHFYRNAEPIKVAPHYFLQIIPDFEGLMPIADPKIVSENTFSTFYLCLSVEGAEVTMHGINPQGTNKQFFRGRHLQFPQTSWTCVQVPNRIFPDTQDFTSISVTRSIDSLTSKWSYSSGSTYTSSSGTGKLVGSHTSTTNAILNGFTHGGAVYPHSSYTEMIAGFFLATVYDASVSTTSSFISEPEAATTLETRANSSITRLVELPAFLGHGVTVIPLSSNSDYDLESVQIFTGLYESYEQVIIH